MNPGQDLLSPASPILPDNNDIDYIIPNTDFGDYIVAIIPPFIEYEIIPAFANDNFTLNATASYSNASVSVIIPTCGQPGFCTKDFFANCLHTPLNDCKFCNRGLAGLLMFFIVLIGILICFGNILIILVEYRRGKRKKTEKINLCKSSLAVADLLTGKLSFYVYQ